VTGIGVDPEPAFESGFDVSVGLVGPLDIGAALAIAFAADASGAERARANVASSFDPVTVCGVS
jgi:hypothetical protein